MALVGVAGLSLMGCQHLVVSPEPAPDAQVEAVEFISPHHLASGGGFSLENQEYVLKDDRPLAEEQENVIPLLNRADPLLGEVRILGFDWPMVSNTGSYGVYDIEEGLASFYHEPQKLATGEQFDPNALTAAHKQLPFGTIVRVTRTDTDLAVTVTINDRGPYIKGRIIDLSYGAARKIDMVQDGVVACRVEVLAYPLIETMGPRGNG